MASPRRIFTIYHRLAADAELIGDFLVAKGDPMPGTIKLLTKRDPGMLLAKWGEEMGELCGVLDGSHADPYLMEATQTFYWASLFAVVVGASWDDLHFDDNRRAAATTGIDEIPALLAAVQRLVEQGPEGAKPEKLFLLWNVADRLYRRQTPAEDQWSLEQILEADFQEMRKRQYLHPLLANVGD